MIRRTLKKRTAPLFAAAAAVLALVLSVHLPQREKFSLHYQGSPEWVPEEFTLFQSLRATRCIPFWSCRWSYWSGFTYKVESAQKRIRATPTGVTFEVDTARILSLGAYQVTGMTLVANPGPDSGERQLLRLDKSPQRYWDVPEGGFKGDFHILDIGAPSYFRLPIPAEVPGGEATIDFDPIAYTRFDLPGRDKWMTFESYCTSSETLLLSVNAARTLHYRIIARPPPGPRQPAPSLTGRVDVFMVDGGNLTGLMNERPDAEVWTRLKGRAIGPENVAIAHDSSAHTVTIEVLAPPREGDLLDKEDVVVLAGMPSADGRYFGMDCVRLKVETKTHYNPVLYTMFEELPERDRASLSGNSCYESGPRLEVKPGVPRTLRYHTTIRPPPKDWDPLPKPKGPAEVFLMDGPTMQKMNERFTPEEWAELRRGAIHPEGVRLAHDAARKTITVKVDGPLKGDYAIVAGTASTDGRFFGMDCVRLKEAGAGQGQNGEP